MNPLERITISPGRRSGKPCIRDTRITVYDVFGYLAAGMTEQEILQDFPDSTHEDILACYAFIAELIAARLFPTRREAVVRRESVGGIAAIALGHLPRLCSCA